METTFFDKQTLAEAAQLLREGQLVAFPTETVYGLGADATNKEAVKAVYTAKNRPSDNPLIVHVANPAEILSFVTALPEIATRLIATFWPGPLTLIFETIPDSLPSAVTGGLTTASFRMPDNELTLALIEQTGRPLVGPSANTSGKPSPTTAEHVYHDLAGKIAGIVADGATSIGLESTVLDLSGHIPTILRPGAVTQGEIEAVIGAIALDPHLASEQLVPKSPGMKYKHYSPDTRVLMIDCEKNNWLEAFNWARQMNLKIGILANAKLIKQFAEKKLVSFSLSSQRDVVAASQNLFAGLRALDELPEKLDLILVETYPEEGQGLAFMNRLKKAANQEFFEA